MAITPIKALLFLVGGSAAATATAYVSGAFDTYLGAPPPEVAALPAAPSGSVASKGNRVTGKAASAPSPPAPPDASAPVAETPAAVEEAPAGKAATADPAMPTELARLAATVTPSFDVVRVESDGSMVVAGKAGPRARIDVVAGADVIGSAAASPEGDFAIVLDKPLEPGDYQISLRSTGPGEVVANSAETAIVSVPEDADGEVLAMVEEPGKPAELISVPEAAGSTPGTPAPAGPTAPAQAVAPSLETPAAEVPAADAVPREPPSAQQSAPPPSLATGAASPQPPAGPAAAAQPSATAGEAREAVPAPAQPAATAAAGPAVMVEAVEIEGSMVFVAGSADPGRRVRVYADSILLGEAVASPQGRFLVEAMRDLPVGDYVIRVDALAPDSATVVARAAVPFEREPGETIAAVAPAPEAVTAGAPAPAGEAAPPDETPPASASPSPAAAGFPAAATQPATEAAPASAAPPASAAAPPAVAEAPLPETGAAPASDTPPASPVSPPATAVAPAAEATPEAASQPAAAEAAATAPAGGAGPLPAAAPAAPGVEIAASDPAAAASPPPAGGLEVTAPRLQSVDSAVIIRRGDSLWRISRRVYGRGIRYSTIYLANQGQITDPDRIWPGQVFKVPDRSNEGEAADMSRIGGQATTLPDQAGQAAQQ